MLARLQGGECGCSGSKSFDVGASEQVHTVCMEAPGLRFREERFNQLQLQSQQRRTNILFQHAGERAFLCHEANLATLCVQVPLDVCAHACHLFGASLYVASRMGQTDTWTELAHAVPDKAVEGLLSCLHIAPARSRAARTLFYLASAPSADGSGGARIEAHGGVKVPLPTEGLLPACLSLPVMCQTVEG